MKAFFNLVNIIYKKINKVSFHTKLEFSLNSRNAVIRCILEVVEFRSVLEKSVIGNILLFITEVWDMDNLLEFFPEQIPVKPLKVRRK